MKPGSAFFPDWLFIPIEILQESQTDGSGFFWVIPEVLHAAHELFLQVVFVGSSFDIIAELPPLTGADVAHYMGVTELIFSP